MVDVCTLSFRDLLAVLELAMPTSAGLLGVETDSRLLGPWSCRPTGLHDNPAAGFLTLSTALPRNSARGDGTDDKFEEDFDVDGE